MSYFKKKEICATFRLKLKRPIEEFKGIGDSPYSIGGGLAEDRYPLMNLVPLDPSPPTLDSPADMTYVVGITGHTITWQPSDANPYWYQIYWDGVVIANAAWEGGRLPWKSVAQRVAPITTPLSIIARIQLDW